MRSKNRLEYNQTQIESANQLYGKSPCSSAGQRVTTAGMLLLVRGRFPALFLVALFIGMFQQACPGQTPEIRAYWADAFNEGMRTSNQVAQLVQQLRADRFNSVVVQVRRRGDALYNSQLEPKYTAVSPASYDPLNDLLTQCHNTNNGPRIDVHAWIVAYAIWSDEFTPPTQTNHAFNLHPDWLTQDIDGQTWNPGEDMYVFDQGHPEVMKHLFKVSMEVLTNYDVDGLNFDRIRYMGDTWGYNPVAVQRFQQLYGRNDIPIANDPQWNEFRRNQVSGFMRKIYLHAAALKPQVKISGDLICGTPGPTNVAGWYSSAPAYNSYFQDWRGWLEEGTLDLAIAMAYFREHVSSQTATFRNWNTFLKDYKYGRQTVVGSAIYLNSLTNSIVQMRQTRTPSANGNYADGVACFSYWNYTTNLSVSRTNWTTALTVSSNGYDPISPALFASNAPIPVMSWKIAPTNGHLKGFIYLVNTNAIFDGATVYLSGPISRAITNDGTGFYGFANVPPGSYTVTATGGTNPPVSAIIGITNGVVTTANLILSAPPPPTDLVVEASQATYTGPWTFSSSSPDRYSPAYAYASTVTAVATADAIFRPHINLAGNYNVYAWHPQDFNRTTNAQVQLVHSNGFVSTRINQTTNGGKWNLFAAAKAFSEGTDGFVRLANDTGEPGKIIVADAIRFLLVGPPTILTQPTGITITNGGTLILSVEAGGPPPFTYQWKLNGTNVPGATNSTLLRTNATPWHAGSYLVVVSNVTSSVTSDAALAQIIYVVPPRAATVQLLADHRIKMQFEGDTGIYGIEASTNLTNWAQILSITNTNGTFLYFDPTDGTQRFYRTKFLP
jgi:uncharacterized lipoprotein YddW (UPF0748 family)